MRPIVAEGGHEATYFFEDGFFVVGIIAERYHDARAMAWRILGTVDGPPSDAVVDAVEPRVHLRWHGKDMNGDVRRLYMRKKSRNGRWSKWIEV